MMVSVFDILENDMFAKYFILPYSTDFVLTLSCAFTDLREIDQYKHIL